MNKQELKELEPILEGYIRLYTRMLEDIKTETYTVGQALDDYYELVGRNPFTDAPMQAVDERLYGILSEAGFSRSELNAY